MTLDLTKLISGVQSQIDFEFEFALDKSYLESIGSVDASLFKVSGYLKKLSERYDLTLTYSGEVVFECHRCLQNVKLTLKNDIKRIVVSERESDVDAEWLTYEGYAIPLVPILEEDITLILPLQVLCAESCKGLCPSCGVDLNKETCTCDETKIDPRLEALKHLFT